MDKKYTVNEFLNAWTDFTDEDKNTLAEEIRKEYIPYVEKVARAQMIVDTTYYINKDKDKFHKNSAANYMLTCLNLVDLYSPISIDYKECIRDYDLLDHSAILYWIMGNISKREMAEFTKICELVSDDEIANNHEIYSFVDKQVERFRDLFEAILTPVIENLDVEKVKEVLENVVDKQG